MLKYLSCWILLALLFGFSTAPEKDPLGTEKLAKELSGLADFKVVWKRCNEFNAYYWIESHEITLCHELKRTLSPAVIRFYLAHEIGHAVILQKKIPFTGNEETAADEFAAWYLTISGRENDVLEAGNHWVERGHVYPPNATHPDDARRGEVLKCYAQLGLEETWDCPRSWKDITRTWFSLLKLRD